MSQSKPYIEKSSKTFSNNAQGKLLPGSKQKIQPLDLFYEIEPAEVLYVISKVSDLETFQITDVDNNPDKSFLNSCIVRKLYTQSDIPILHERGDEIFKYLARPLDPSLLKIPITGEIVPIINFVSSKSTSNINRKISYYMSTVNAWNSPHHNSLPNISALESLEEATSEILLLREKNFQI